MITLIVGPPCSGKTTYAQQHAQPGDLIVDADQIAVDLGSPRDHNHHAEYAKPAEAHVLDLLDDIADGRHPDAWVIRTAPSATARADIAQHIGADRVVVLTTDRATLAARAQQRPNPAATIRIIDWWLDVAHTDTAASRTW